MIAPFVEPVKEVPAAKTEEKVTTTVTPAATPAATPAVKAAEQAKTLVKKGTQPKETTQGGRPGGKDKLGKEFTWVEREVAGQKVLVKKYDTPEETQAGKGTRTKKADAEKQHAKVDAAVQAASDKLRAKAEAEHESPLKADVKAERRAEEKARTGRPSFRNVPTADQIHERMLEETRTASLAKEQAANAEYAGSTRSRRKAKTEATEKVTRDAAISHVENLSEDHQAHGDEENVAAALKSNADRDVARGQVIERARKMVSDIEAKINATISGAAKWSKEGKVKQNTLNALRDTKTMLDRWDKQRSDDPGSLEARDTRAKKLNQDFVDHYETMDYLRRKQVEGLGERREGRSKERTASEREKGGKKSDNRDRLDGETRQGSYCHGKGDKEEREARLAHEAELSEERLHTAEG